MKGNTATRVQLETLIQLASPFSTKSINGLKLLIANKIY